MFYLYLLQTSAVRRGEAILSCWDIRQKSDFLAHHPLTPEIHTEARGWQRDPQLSSQRLRPGRHHTAAPVQTQSSTQTGVGTGGVETTAPAQTQTQTGVLVYLPYNLSAITRPD
jgi:hypothetical protein